MICREKISVCFLSLNLEPKQLMARINQLRRNTMELITKSIIENTPGLYETEETPIGEKVVTAKYFAGVFTWYMTEYDPKTKIAYGYVDNLSDPMLSEWGTFSIQEFEDYNKTNSFPMIERDLYFDPVKFKELKIPGMW
ncbi:DUF2958 domain-containing protein [Bacillus paralicheniformis]|nr:DUF2958 domain-containing protein [Bacillus paralicheniformis]